LTVGIWWAGIKEGATVLDSVYRNKCRYSIWTNL